MSKTQWSSNVLFVALILPVAGNLKSADLGECMIANALTKIR
jgi:hypothetical protein